MRYFVVTLTILTTTLNAVAQDAEAPAFDSYDYNASAFQQTESLCRNVESSVESEPGAEPQSDIDYLGLLKFGVSGTKTGFFFWRKESFRVTPETAALVHSDGFRSALYACFGDNEMKQKAFKGSILALDFVGHLVGMTVWLFPVSFVARVFRSTKWAMANPGVIRGLSRLTTYVNRAAIVAVAGMMGYEAWDSYQMRSQSKERLGELTESIVDSSQAESDESFVILQKMLDDTNLQLTQVAPNDPKLKSLQQRKTILEQRLKLQHRETG